MSISYKDMLTNMLVVFINRRIKESKDIEDKVNSLEEDKKKKLQSKIVDFVISKAKGLAELQGTQYLGVEDETVVNWINDFFDNFEENTKEPEKKKVEKTVTTKTTKTVGTSSKEALSKATREDLVFEVSEGILGLEVKYDKKTFLEEDEFESKMKELYKEGYEIIWDEDKVTVKFKSETKPKKDKPKKELGSEELEDDVTALEKIEDDIDGPEDTEEDTEEDLEDDIDGPEDIEDEDDGLL